MQTFSIACGEYEGYSFRVNPVDSSMVEFVHPNPDGESATIAQFNRNGSLVGKTVVPAARQHEVVRNASTGTPELPAKAPEAETTDQSFHPYQYQNEKETALAEKSPPPKAPKYDAQGRPTV